MNQTISRAHEIRKEAAAKFGGKPGDYSMKIACEMAKNGEKVMSRKTAESAYQDFLRVENLAKKEGRTHCVVEQQAGRFYLVGQRLPVSYAKELQREKTGRQLLAIEEYKSKFDGIDAITFELYLR